MHSDEDPKPDPSLEAIAARLRALAAPPVPAGLEARLLAAICELRPGRISPVSVADSGNQRQAWLALASSVLALATVEFVAVFAWHGGGDKGFIPVSDTAPLVDHDSISAADEWAGIAMSSIDRRMFSASDLSAFRWPVQEWSPAKVSSTIPGNLFD
jgi:hypothetical protein